MFFKIPKSYQYFLNFQQLYICATKPDSIKTGNDNFYIKVNKTHEELKEITIAQDMEQYFNQLEQNAITNRSDENQFKARIVNKFSRAVAYNFLKNLSFIYKMDNVLELHLKNTLSLTPSEEMRLLWEAQSIGGYSDIEKIKITI